MTGVVAVLLLFFRPTHRAFKNENRFSFQAQCVLQAEDSSWRPYGFDPGSATGFVMRDRSIPSKTIPSDGERYLEVMFQLPGDVEVGQQLQLTHVTHKPSSDGETSRLRSGECVCLVYAYPRGYPAKTSSVKGRVKILKLDKAIAVLNVQFSAMFEGGIGLIGVDQDYKFLR
jgi:hypothetical protein